ncbi:MAG: 50S ribosomal protein L7/L12 [bacterium]|nr:50S ribosomal protein L7/L12 [bacterium]
MDKLQQIIDQVGELKVTELADLVKKMEEKFGVSAAMPVMAGGAGGGAGAEEEKTSWNIMLKDAGAQKIQVIKAVKEITGLGLQEAKALVDGAPKVVKEGLKKEEAEEMKKKLTEAGAVIELQ